MKHDLINFFFASKFGLLSILMCEPQLPGLVID